MHRPKDPVLRIIGVLKLFKAAALIAFGIAALHLIGHDVAHDVRRWISELHLDPGNHYFAAALAKLSGADGRMLAEVGIGAMCYAALFTVEGVGLILRKVWAEYVTCIVTSSFVPLELYEVIEWFSWVKLIVLLLNVAIVVYLVFKLRKQRLWPFRGSLPV